MDLARPGFATPPAERVKWRAVFAFLENIGTMEMIIVAIAALLVFGKRLPEVASQAGTALARFKRDLTKTWDDTGMEREIRKLREVLPKDMSVSDVARLAAERMEKRIRENVAEAAPPESVEPKTVDAPTKIEPSDSPTAPPSLEAPPEVPPGSSSSSMPTPDASPTHGVDPAKHFGPPNSIPREG